MSALTWRKREGFRETERKRVRVVEKREGMRKRVVEWEQLGVREGEREERVGVRQLGTRKSRRTERERKERGEREGRERGREKSFDMRE